MIRHGLLFPLILLLLLPLPSQADGAKTPLRFGLTPVILDDRLTYLARLRDYLQTELGRPVELVQRSSYGEIMELLEREELDAAWICGYPYVKHRDQLDLVATPRYRGEPLYQSYLITRSGDDTIDGWESLAGLVFAYSDPDSNSGYLYPRHALNQRGHDSEEFLGRTFFTGSHQAVIEAVAAGLAQAGAVDGYVWETLREKQPELVEQTRIVRRSQSFGFPPIVAGAALPGAERRRLRQGLLQMELDPEGQDLLRLLSLDGFMETPDALYDDIATIVHELDQKTP